MAFTLAGPTQTELAAWITQNVGPEITNDYAAATQLLETFDIAAKDGTSLSNRHQIASALAPTPTGTLQHFFAPLAADAAAQHLLETFRVTRKPDNYPQLLVDLPTPVVVSRHQCPFCRRYTRADPRQVTDHMTRCWQNPRLRCCKTCTHHQDASGTPGHVDEWEEACTHTDGPEDDYRFPVLHCPLWEARKA